MVAEITSAQQFQQAIAADKLVVVDFYATWCGPCRMIAPMIEKFSQQYTGADFYKVDVDQLPDVAASSEVSAMPTFKFYKNGKEVTTVVGANAAAIQQALAAHA